MRKETFLLIGALVLAILVVACGLPARVLGCAPAQGVSDASREASGRPAHSLGEWPQVVSGSTHLPSREGPVGWSWPGWAIALLAPFCRDGLQAAPHPQQWSQQGEYASTGPIHARAPWEEIWALRRQPASLLLLGGLLLLAAFKAATARSGTRGEWARPGTGAAQDGARGFTTLPMPQVKPPRPRSEAQITLRGDQVADWERDRLVPK